MFDVALSFFSRYKAAILVSGAKMMYFCTFINSNGHGGKSAYFNSKHLIWISLLGSNNLLDFYLYCDAFSSLTSAPAIRQDVLPKVTEEILRTSDDEKISDLRTQTLANSHFTTSMVQSISLKIVAASCLSCCRRPSLQPEAPGSSFAV